MRYPVLMMLVALTACAGNYQTATGETLKRSNVREETRQTFACKQEDLDREHTYHDWDGMQVGDPVCQALGRYGEPISVSRTDTDRQSYARIHWRFYGIKNVLAGAKFDGDKWVLSSITQ